MSEEKISEGEHWQLTCKLRLLLINDNPIAYNNPKLQQMLQGSKGGQVWVDVPLVTE